jgi:hypothetical protein
VSPTFNQTAAMLEVLPFWREYLRPWKLATYAIGLLLLIAGSFYYQAPD